MEAGVAGLRLNPGNIRKPEHIKAVASEAKDRGLPIRIGVNAGSLDPDIFKQYGGATPEALVASAQRELDYFAEVGFEDVKISVKSSNVPTMIDAYRLLSETVDFPLHLGVTEAGPLPGGLLKSTAGIATLLADHVRIPGNTGSLADDATALRTTRDRLDIVVEPEVRPARVDPDVEDRFECTVVVGPFGFRVDGAGDPDGRAGQLGHPHAPPAGQRVPAADQQVRGIQAGRSAQKVGVQWADRPRERPIDSAVDERRQCVWHAFVGEGEVNRQVAGGLVETADDVGRCRP